MKLPRIEALDLRTEEGKIAGTFAQIEARLAEIAAAMRGERPPAEYVYITVEVVAAPGPRAAVRRWARGQIDRHGLRCRFCGLPLDARDQLLTHDAVECVGCRRRIPRISIVAARGRPVRAVLFGV